MSTRRNKQADREATRQILLRPQKDTGGKSWLDHGGGAGRIDYQLLTGTTLERMRRERGGVGEHLRHLEEEHGLLISRNEDGHYSFEHQHVGLDEAVPVAGMFGPYSAEELLNPDGYLEGAVHSITVNAYERNPESRGICISHYGAKCVVCGFAFGPAYGQVAEGFIHVHHIKPLSEIGTEYRVDPIADLRPVCPNCHAVIHLGGITRAIDEVRLLLKRFAKSAVHT